MDMKIGECVLLSVLLYFFLKIQNAAPVVNSTLFFFRYLIMNLDSSVDRLK